jgi:hypothetical protein
MEAASAGRFDDGNLRLVSTMAGDGLARPYVAGLQELRSYWLVAIVERRILVWRETAAHAAPVGGDRVCAGIPDWTDSDFYSLVGIPCLERREPVFS